MVAVHAGFTRKGHYGRSPFSTSFPVKDHPDSICRLFPISKEESARNIWIRRLQSGQCLAGSASFFFRNELWSSDVTTSTSMPPQSPPPSKAKQRRASSKTRRVFKKKRATKKRKATT